MFFSPKKKPRRLPEANPPDSGEDPADPGDLLLTIAAANVVMLGGIVVSLAFGYHESQLNQMPALFWIVFAAVIGIGGIASLSGVIAGKLLRSFLSIDVPLNLPKGILKIAVYILTIATIAVLGYVVNTTGGSASSPFTPFLTAPAVFAPFMARRSESIIFIGAAVIVAIWITEGGEPFATANGEVYSAVSTALIVIAAIMAAARRALGIDGHPPART
jgi:hypothetical protein